mmetsp:Transcript_93024/g.199506  ORF Transcript_93024/g.199506 Transcript_93024/m.199506 type:complete len:86 (+) Transcript_93024:81-338(+)
MPFVVQSFLQLFGRAGDAVNGSCDDHKVEPVRFVALPSRDSNSPLIADSLSLQRMASSQTRVSSWDSVKDSIAVTKARSSASSSR